MVPSAYASGTQTIAALNTEYFLSSPNVAGTFVFEIDTSAMAAGDSLTMNVYNKVLSGGAVDLCYSWVISGAQSIPVWISVPVPNDLAEANGLRFSINQTAGTARSFPWKVLQL